MTDNESAWGPGENPDDFPTRASRRRAGGHDASTGPISEVPRFADRFSPPEQAPRPAPDAAEESTVRRPVLDIRLDENAASTWTTTVPVTVPVGPAAEQPQAARTEQPKPAAPGGSTIPPGGSTIPPGNSAARPGSPAMPPRPTAKPADAPEGRRRSFLAADNRTVPAETGFRGLLTKLGIRIPPSKRELTERANTRQVSQHWPGPRTISVVNGKGGANKTPTTVMLASVFARNGGGPVLAWDNNETRGTLGWRTEQGPHNSTVMDLLPQTDQLLAPSAQSALLARYVHHQTEDKYDVLRSKPDVLASEQKVTSDDFDALHEVASKYFRLNIVDSGNDETAERWLRMIHHTDQLVIATTTLEEHAEAGALLLEALRARGGKYEELSQNAVVIVSQSDKNGTAAQAQAIADGFNQLARHAVTIPYDVALLKGRIRWGSLRPVTQSAWLGAAAAVAGGL